VAHVFLAVYIVSFSLGLVVITVGSLARVRSGLAAFRHATLLFVSALVLLLCEILKTYEIATLENVFGDALAVISVCLSVSGNGVLSYMICLIAYEVVLLPVAPSRRAIQVVLAAAAAAVGAAKEIFPVPFLLALNYALLTGILVYAVATVARRMDRVRNQRFQSLIRSIVITTEVMVAAMVVQIIGQLTRLAPQILSDFPLVQMAFYLVIAGLLIFHAVQYLFQGDPADYRLPDLVVKRYGISPREQEIITMLVQGFPNRVIGEKLFISSTTVKNHIYHIYQKTGVANKVQLINLINSPK